MSEPLLIGLTFMGGGFLGWLGWNAFEAGIVSAWVFIPLTAIAFCFGVGTSSLYHDLPDHEL